MCHVCVIYVDVSLFWTLVFFADSLPNLDILKQINYKDWL